MKKINKILVLVITILLVLSGTTLAKETTKKYVVTKELVYENKKNTTINNGFVEVFVGRTNFVQYQKDTKLTIIPEPDSLDEDEFGNVTARYNIKNFLPGQQLKITINREVEVSTYTVSIPRSANTELTDENRKYIFPQPKVQSDHDLIIKKAEELTKGEASDYRKAYEIYKYVNVEMTYDTDKAYANKGALSALKTKRGVCEEFATLFVAMCRAENIPARLVEGYKLESTKPDKNGNIKAIPHVWADIYLKDYGWVPVEPTIVYEGQKRVYENGYAKLEDIDHIATGIYHKSIIAWYYMVDEVSYKVTVSEPKEIEERKFTFKDITPDYEWSLDSIKNLYNLNIVNGYDNNEYRPQNNITRIEFIAMLSRVLTKIGAPTATGGKVYYYPDYDQGHWSKKEYDILMRCYQAVSPSDIASYGYNNIAYVFDNSFDMNKPITRAEVVALMDAFMRKTYSDTVFSDVEGHKFMSSIKKSVSNNLIKGYPDGTFRPDNNITRAEMAVVLDRYISSDRFSLISTAEAE